MARRLSEAALKKQLAEVGATRSDPTTPAAAHILGDALASPSSFVVEAATRVVAEHELAEHAPALRAAYARIAPGAAASDPGCKAKVALVEALARLGVAADDVYLRAIRTVQMEPSFGPPIDTAVAVRSGAAVGLAQSLHPDAAVLAAELLVDKEWDARAGAARALGLCTREAAEPVLRHKLRSGDREPAVIGECLRALLALSPSALPLVAERLRDADAEVSEQAALALGESRLDAAFELLTAFVADEPDRARRRVAMVAIALLRRDAAIDWLLARVADDDTATAVAAIEALAIFRHDARLCERLVAAAEGRKELGEALGKVVGGRD